MVSPLSNLVNNIAEGIHKINCKDGRDYKKSKNCRVKYRDCD